MKIKALLGLLILTGIFLSAWGITADLPYSRVSTEIEQVNIALKFGSGDLNPHYFLHPSFFAYILFIFYGLFFLIGKILLFFRSVSDFELLYFKDPSLFYLIARGIISFIFGLIIWTAFVLAKKLYDKRVAILTCIFIVFSPVFIKWAHFASSDMPMVLISLISFNFIIKFFKSNKLSDYLMAAVLAGLATATKYNAAPLIAPIILVNFLSSEKKSKFARLFNERSVIAIIFVLLGFILGCPYSVFDFRVFASQILESLNRMNLNYYNFASWRVHGPGWLYILTDVWPFGLSLPIMLLAILGIVHSLIRHKKEDLLVLSFIIGSYLIAGKSGFLKPRHFLHIYPFMFILAARFIVDLFAKIKIPQKRKALLISIALILLLCPAFTQIIKFDVMVSQKTLALEAKSWIENNIPAGSKIAAMTGVALVPNKDSILRKLKEVKEKNIGPGIELEKLLQYQYLFKKTYDITELPYPWREDFDESDFDFRLQIKNGVKYFVLTQELDEYLNNPVKYAAQYEYYSNIKDNCTLIEEFKQPRLELEPAYASNLEYILIYKLKKG